MTLLDAPAVSDELSMLVDKLLGWLETGVRRDDLFAADAFLDLSVPFWRLQARGAEAVVKVREDDHPYTGQVRVEALDRTSRGFLLEFSERWQAQGQTWYCRELMHCIVVDGLIEELVVYCTGDWDQSVQEKHAADVRLIRQ